MIDEIAGFLAEEEGNTEWERLFQEVRRELVPFPDRRRRLGQIVMPTGAGKTALIGRMMKSVQETSRDVRFLYLTDRMEEVRQTAEILEEAYGLEVRKGEKGGDCLEFVYGSGQVFAATYFFWNRCRELFDGFHDRMLLVADNSGKHAGELKDIFRHLPQLRCLGINAVFSGVLSPEAAELFGEKTYVYALEDALPGLRLLGEKLWNGEYEEARKLLKGTETVRTKAGAGQIPEPAH